MYNFSNGVDERVKMRKLKNNYCKLLIIKIFYFMRSFVNGTIS
jgi:hypothetical protein